MVFGVFLKGWILYLVFADKKLLYRIVYVYLTLASPRAYGTYSSVASHVFVLMSSSDVYVGVVCLEHNFLRNRNSYRNCSTHDSKWHCLREEISWCGKCNLWWRCFGYSQRDVCIDRLFKSGLCYCTQLGLHGDTYVVSCSCNKSYVCIYRFIQKLVRASGSYCCHIEYELSRLCGFSERKSFRLLQCCCVVSDQYHRLVYGSSRNHTPRYHCHRRQQCEGFVDSSLFE